MLKKKKLGYEQHQVLAENMRACWSEIKVRVGFARRKIKTSLTDDVKL